MTAALFASIWIALVLLVAGEAGRRFKGAACRWPRAAWMAGAAFCAVHMAIAFFGVHGGSQAAVDAATARETEAVYGVAWGGGAYVNYAFLLVWIAEAAWWSATPRGYDARPLWWTWIVRLFFLVVVFNAAVVFAGAAARIAGVVWVLALAFCWLPLGGGVHSKRDRKRLQPS